MSRSAHARRQAAPVVVDRGSRSAVHFIAQAPSYGYACGVSEARVHGRSGGATVERERVTCRACLDALGVGHDQRQAIPLAEVVASQPDPPEVAVVCAMVDRLPHTRVVDEDERERLLESIERNAVGVAVRGSVVLVRLRGGGGGGGLFALIRVRDANGAPIVVFDVVASSADQRRSFWFNASSVRATGEKLRALPRLPISEIVL